MPAFILRSDPLDERTKLLSNLLAEHRVRATPVAQLDDVSNALPDDERSLVFVPDMLGDATAVLAFSEKANGRAFVVYISDTITADSYKQLAKSRAGEWVRWGNLATEFADVLRSQESSARRESGSVVAFLPSSGGVGNTTLAVETAIYLASGRKAKQRRVCVLDLNLQSSAIPAYLDVEPRFDITDLLQEPKRLDQHLVEILATKHPSGVDVFTSPPCSLDYGRLDPAIIFALLDEITKRYQIVHLDLPTMWFSWIDNLLLGSDRIVVTGAFNIPSVKRVALKLQNLRRLGISSEHIISVINKSESGMFAGGVLRRSDITSALPGVQISYVRRDARTAADALNAGRSIIQSSSGRGMKKDLKQLGEWIDRARREMTAPALGAAA